MSEKSTNSKVIGIVRTRPPVLYGVFGDFVEGYFRFIAYSGAFTVSAIVLDLIIRLF